MAIRSEQQLALRVDDVEHDLLKLAEILGYVHVDLVANRPVFFTDLVAAIIADFLGAAIDHDTIIGYIESVFVAEYAGKLRSKDRFEQEMQSLRRIKVEAVAIRQWEVKLPADYIEQFVRR